MIFLNFYYIIVLYLAFQLYKKIKTFPIKYNLLILIFRILFDVYFNINQIESVHAERKI